MASRRAAADSEGGEEGIEVMTDADFEQAMEALRDEGSEDVGELLRMMNENRMISWEEAEQIMGGSANEPIKSSLPQQTRPTEPDNDTDVDRCIQRLCRNDPALIEINLNNMKRTPIPQVKRVIEAIRENTYLEKLSLANMGLYDQDIAPLIEIVAKNDVLRSVNLETNYLSGDFFAKLFQAALNNQSLEELKAVNQGVSFSTQSEREMIDAITKNRGLTKVSINIRLPEGRYKIEQATIRNQEIRRILRRQQMQQEKQQQQPQEKAAAAQNSKPAKPPTKAVAQPANEVTKKRDSLRVARDSFESPLAVAGAANALSAGKQLYEKTKADTAAAKASRALPDFSEKKTGAVAERAKAFRDQSSSDDAAATTKSLGKKNLPPKPKASATAEKVDGTLPGAKAKKPIADQPPSSSAAVSERRGKFEKRSSTTESSAAGDSSPSTAKKSPAKSPPKTLKNEKESVENSESKLPSKPNKPKPRAVPASKKLDDGTSSKPNADGTATNNVLTRPRKSSSEKSDGEVVPAKKSDPLDGMRRGGPPRLPTTMTSVADRAKLFGK